MHRVWRIDQPVQGLFSDSPVTIHAKEHHPRVGRRDVNQVADAFHVRLPGEHPKVADEHVVHGDRLDVLTGFDLALDRVWSAGRHAEQFRVGLAESDPGVARGWAHHGAHELAVLHGFGQRDRDLCLAVGIALVNAEFARFLQLCGRGSGRPWLQNPVAPA